MSLAVTPYYLAANALLLLVLAFGVTRQRVKTKVSFGDGGVPALQQAIRVHGNAVEYVPIAMLLLIALELAGLGEVLLHVLGVVFTSSRVIHALGLGSRMGRSFGRYWGTVGTWGTILAAVLLLLAQTAGRM